MLKYHNMRVREVALPLMLAGASVLSACSQGASASERMQAKADAAVADYLGEFGCEITGVTVSVVSEDEQEFVLPTPSGGANYLDALTTQQGDIYLNQGLLSEESVTAVTTHEMTHACEDRTDQRDFPDMAPASDGSEMRVVGAQGFVMLFAAKDGSMGSNPLLEEAVADWVAQESTDFNIEPAKDGYAAVRATVETLATMRGIDHRQALEMQRNDDLAVFVGKLYQKPVEQLTADDFVRVAELLQTAQDTNAVPSQLQIEAFLGIDD